MDTITKMPDNSTIPICTESLSPVAYRLRKDRIDGLVLQGCYTWTEETGYPFRKVQWHEWRDIPTVRE
jgi:hypothetical protein